MQTDVEELEEKLKIATKILENIWVCLQYVETTRLQSSIINQIREFLKE